jgi:hypothetical protein
VSSFERGDRLLSTYGRKVVQEFFEVATTLEIVDQVPEGNPRTDEHGGRMLPIAA